MTSLLKNIVILFISVSVGALVGIAFDRLHTVEYISKMVVEPHFDSVHQLYENIDFYDDLVKANDVVGLAIALGISAREAASIREVFVDAHLNGDQRMKFFDRFGRELDSAAQRAIDLDSYLRNFSTLNARFHQITLVGTDAAVAKKVEPAIIGANGNGPENGRVSNREPVLMPERETLRRKSSALNKEKANRSNMINTINGFPDKGVELRNFWNRYIFLVPKWTLTGTLAVLVMMKIMALFK